MIPVAVFALGFLLRLAMLLSEKSLWGDEWFSMDLAQKSFYRVFVGSLQDVHPPLYFLALHGVIGVFGDAEWVYRLISFLAGSMTVVVIYFLTKVIFGKEAALYALFLAAVSPYGLQISNEIRSYALLGLVSSLTLLFFVWALREPGRKAWRAGYAICAILAIYIEHYAWFVVLATAAVLLWEKRPLRDRQTLWRAFLKVSAAGAASMMLVAYQAIFREHMFEGYRIREYWSFAVLFKKIVGVPWHFTNGYFFSMLTPERVFHHLRHSPLFWISAAATVAAALLLVHSFKSLFLKDKTVFRLVLMVLCFPALFLLGFYSIRLNARYLSFAAPLFFVMLGGGLASIGRRRWRTVFFLLLSFTAAFGSWQAIVSKTDAAHKEDYRALISYVFSHAGHEDVICGLSPQVRYYRERLSPKPQAAIVAELSDLEAQNTRAARRIWVLDQLNMHDEVWLKNYGGIQAQLEGLGFRPAGTPRRFGGEEGLVVACLFERK